MERDLAKADKEVLVKVIKIAQKQGLEGSRGGWKAFLKGYDRKVGDSISDPARRSIEVLQDFLRTFTEEAHLKLFSKVIGCHRNHVAVEKRVDLPDYDFPEQRLVHMTIKHPQYKEKYWFPLHLEDWMVIPMGKVSKAMQSRNMIAVDCEMVLCQDGFESLVKVCVVDHNLEVKLNMLVKPKDAIADYRTEITGIASKDLDGVTCSLRDVQKSLKKLLKHGTILVGHSLYNDLRALKIDHARVIDTSFIFTYRDSALKTPSLNNLCKSVLGYEIRKEGDAHNCVEDARSAMKLVLAKQEHGFSDPIVVARKTVPDSDLGKLLLHYIPHHVPTSELPKIFSARSHVDIETATNVRGWTYSTFAVFKDSKEANEAFLEAEGQEYTDSGGRLQKLVKIQLSSGKIIEFYVCKTTPDAALRSCDSSKKRLAEDDNNVSDSKKLKITSCECLHVEEVERLKEELKRKEDHISNLNNTISQLKRKQLQHVADIERMKRCLKR